MGNEFLREIDANRSKSIKSKEFKKKCCITGIHNPENGQCIQSMRPFRDNIELNSSFVKKSDFVKEILRERDSKFGESNLDLEDSDLEDIDSIVNSFSRVFNINDY